MLRDARLIGILSPMSKTAETVRTFWETMTSKPAGSRRLVREWLVNGHVVRFEVVCESVVLS
jgi:hypothetical protein